MPTTLLHQQRSITCPSPSEHWLKWSVSSAIVLFNARHVTHLLRAKQFSGVRGREKVPTCGQVEVPAGGQLKSPPSVRRVDQELMARAVTVKVPTTHRTTRGVPLKSARDRMDIISTYNQVGSYRAAAELCGTTHKTVKRTVERFEAEQAGHTPTPASNVNTTTTQSHS